MNRHSNRTTAQAGGRSAGSTETTEHDSGIDSDETLEDKRHKMSDLLHRLGLSQPERQNGFRIYAHQTYGRGWIERIVDVDAMNARLTARTRRSCFARR